MAELYHYGTKEHSGRYPFGSGERPYQRLQSSRGLNRIYKISKKESKLSSKKQRNDEKIDKLYSKLNVPKSLRKEKEIANLYRKALLYKEKARGAEIRLAKGKKLSRHQQKRIARLRNAEAAIARAEKKGAKYRSKISNLDYKNSVINKKLEKLSNKKMSEVSKLELEYGKKAVERALKNLEMTKQSSADFNGDRVTGASVNKKK